MHSNKTAVLRGDTEIIKLLLDSGANVNFIEAGHGDTALKYAVERGNFEIAKLLITAGANVNMEMGTVGCPVIYYADYRNSEIVKLLLDSGADVNLRCQLTNEDTPLMRAVSNGDVESVSLLLNAGADVNAERRGRTALSIASKKGDYVVVNILKLAGAKE